MLPDVDSHVGSNSIANSQGETVSGVQDSFHPCSEAVQRPADTRRLVPTPTDVSLALSVRNTLSSTMYGLVVRVDPK